MKEVIQFLTDLKANNNRECFNNNKAVYQLAHKTFENFVEDLYQKTFEFDKAIGVQKAKSCMFRIYRDVRFSKNKEPYKTNFGAYIARGGRKGKYAGYYIHLEPGMSFAGGGLYRPQPDVLKAVRKEIYYRLDDFKKLITDVNFKKVFGEIQGERLKLPPKGFPKNFEGIELLKFKDYFVAHQLKDTELISNNAPDQLAGIFATMKPINDFFNNAIDMDS